VAAIPGTTRAGPAADDNVAGAADLDILRRWFEALQAAEPSVLGALVQAGDDGRQIAAFGMEGQSDDAIGALIAAARDRGKLQLATLKGEGRTGMAAPLRRSGAPSLMVAAILERPLAEASRFAPSFQLSLDRLGQALDQRSAVRPVRAAIAPPSASLPPAEVLELLQAPNAEAFELALFDKLAAALRPDSAYLAQVRRGNSIRVLRSSTKGDPLPRGSRIGHSRRVALLSVAAADGVLFTATADPANAVPTNLDLGMLCTKDGPKDAVAVAVSDLSGRARLVYLAEYIDRRDPAAAAALLPGLESLDHTLHGLRGSKTVSRRTGKLPLGRWALQAAAGLAAIAALVWLGMPAPLMITGEATLTSTNQRSIVATRDGILAKVYFEPGESVRAGDVIAEFDTRELRLRANRIAAQVAQAQSRKQSAVAGFKAAEMRVVDAEIDALTAESALIDLLLEQSRVVASEDAMILSGEMSERVGSAMRKGEIMFQLAPLGGYAVSIDVPQQDATNVVVAQTGSLKLTAMPFDDFAIRIARIAPAANEASATGAFTIRADLLADNPSFRPGMKGVAHIHAGESIRIWALSRDFVFWARMLIWRWIP
jgi:hypothetical protein